MYGDAISAWPPKEAEARTLYFQANGGLGFDPPASDSTAFDEYVSDPAKPVPFVNYAAISVPQEYMLSDQRFADSRTDVLVYENAGAAGRRDDCWFRSLRDFSSRRREPIPIGI